MLAMTMGKVRFRVNDREQAIDADGGTPLLDVLRDGLGLKGTRFGCGAEQCGACFVVLEGKALASCTLPLSAVAGKSITPLESLRTPDAPHPPHDPLLAPQAGHL